MKKLTKLLPLVMVMVMCFTVSVFAAETSYDVSANGDGSVTAVFNDETGVLTISGNGRMADYSTSSEGPYAEHYKEITGIVVENGVTYIGEYAFYYFQYLESIEIASSVEEIGYRAFYQTAGSDTLALTLPEGLKTIAEGAFANSEITSLSIPSSVTSIGEGAFNQMTYLKNFELKTTSFGLTEDTFSANMGRNADNKTATVPASQVWVKDYLESLGYVVSTTGSATTDEMWASYPSESVFEMGANNPSDVMGYFNSITGVFTVRGSGAMADYTMSKSIPYVNGFDSEITSIVIEEGITSIGSYAFLRVGATSISLPSTLTTISEGAFRESTLLESLTIPASVTSIGEDAFYSCPELKTLTFETNSQLTIIGDRAFSNCNKLTSIVLPDGLVTIGEGAFEYCWLITELVIPASVTEIGAEAFYMYARDITDRVVEVVNYGGADQFIGEQAFETTHAAKISYNSSNTAMSNAIANSGTAPSEIVDLGSSGSGGSGEGEGTGGTGTGGSGEGEGTGGSGEGEGTGGSGEGEGTGGSGEGEGTGGSGESGSGDGSDTDTDIPGTTENTMIIVDAEPTNFLVTVPIRIDVEMDAEGVVTTGDGYYVANECAMGPIIITDIKVVAETNWSLVDWNSDFHNMKASSKVIALTINGVEVGVDGSVVMNDSLSSVIRNKESKELFFGAKLTAQKSALQANAAAVVFTVDFDKV